MVMRQVDVVLSVLTLVAVGMGVAAYRAWNPPAEPMPVVSDTTPVPPPLRAVVARTPVVPVYLRSSPVVN